MQQENRKFIPYVSIALVVINVVLFLIGEFDGGRLLASGEIDIENVLVHKEYARLIWYMFLHAGISHIFSNMVILYFMGTLIEQEIGHMFYGLIYFLSGLGGGVFSLYIKVLNRDMVGTVGASAAIFGLEGLLLAMVLLTHSPIPGVNWQRVLLMIALSLYSCVGNSNIDGAGHLGGVVVGFGLGVIYCLTARFRKGVSEKRSKRGEKP